jgi:hypothetical protein
MSMARDLIDAALAADLTQNELKVFLALFRQTITYGKTADPLTLKRLVTISKVRKDRLISALAQVLGKGLYQSIPHPIYESTYQIPNELLAKYSNTIHLPTLPKIRNISPLPEPISEKPIHTDINLTKENLTTTLPYPLSFNTTQKQEAAKILDGLIFQDAVSCLTLLNRLLSTGNIKSPLGYLYYLAKSARQGTLDRSTIPLTSDSDAQSTSVESGTSTVPDPLKNRTDTIKINRIRELQQELYSLDQLYSRAGFQMDVLTANKRERWLKELQQLN